MRVLAVFISASRIFGFLDRGEIVLVLAKVALGIVGPPRNIDLGFTGGSVVTTEGGLPERLASKVKVRR